MIRTTDLAIRFGEVVAVDGLTLEVGAGEVFGVLGHNGAGKTTTVRLLNGILAPTADGRGRGGAGAFSGGRRPRATPPHRRSDRGSLGSTSG